MSEMKPVLDAIEASNRAFEEFKKANDAKLEAIQKGGATGDLEAKLKAIADDMAAFKADQKKALEDIEAKSRRPALGADGKPLDELQPKSTRRPSAATSARARTSTAASSRRRSASAPARMAATRCRRSSTR
jgi:hypothetical protein